MERLLSFSIEGTDRVDQPFVVSLTIDGGEPIRNSFECDVGPKLQRFVSKINAGSDIVTDDLREVGGRLWEGLLAGETGEMVSRIVADRDPVEDLIHVHLSLPSELEPLPWEALFEQRHIGFLAQKESFLLSRAVPQGVAAPREKREEVSPLRVLSVIPAGSGLQVDREWQVLDSSCRKAGELVQSHMLRDTVTVAGLSDTLRADPWHVVHFVGHGKMDDTGTVKIRLNEEDGVGRDRWVTADVFASMFDGTPVRLVVMNCCMGAAWSTNESLSGVAPPLARAGVPAVVAMRYEIPDNLAIVFTRTLYDELLTGSHAGRIDRAMLRVRQKIYLQQRDDQLRGFITPALYLEEGQGQLFEIEPVADTGAVPTVHLSNGDLCDVPDKLVAAVASKRCIPVVGAGFLEGDPSRLSSATSTPGGLVAHLMEKASCPFDGAAPSEGWGAISILPWICQHFIHKNPRWELIEALNEVFQQCEPPRAFAGIVSWNPPAIVNLSYDGLLDDVAGDALRPHNKIDQQLGIATDDPLLVNVRGTRNDSESLVLTIEEQDHLLDRIGKACNEVENLVKGRLGRALVFLGVHPRDPVVRRMARLLLTDARNADPSYFVSKNGTVIDQGYWSSQGVEWIDEHPENVVRTVTSRIEESS